MTFTNSNQSLSRWGWAFLSLALLTAGLLRFWGLGDAPPGLYRDEAYNGLDALAVLDGEHALFFEQNNGREPAYIYLTAASTLLFGRSALAVRFGAALVGSLTTLLVYLLAQSWFKRDVGLYAAAIWAVTLWPIHLSRIGLRPILLPATLALALWLGTLAYRRNGRWLWLAAGLAYGATFYTYLASRFTPLFLLPLALFLVWRGYGKRLWPGVLWFGIGLTTALLPWLILWAQQPELILGRSDQVSIFNPAISDGRPWRLLLENIWGAVALFFWEGDDILRHNPPGRPVFDWLMVGFWLWGVGWCIKNWRRSAAAALLLWSGVMLGPTILAEDTPHFLRAVGILPGILMFPAIGLSQLGAWPKLPTLWRLIVPVLIIVGSGIVTVRDYNSYVQQPETAYLFEAAARDLAEQINSEPAGRTLWLDPRYAEGWSSIPYLITRSDVASLPPATSPAFPTLTPPSSIYTWPFAADALEAQLAAIQPPARVALRSGPLARGDLEENPYPLYLEIRVDDVGPVAAGTAVEFGDQLQLLHHTVQLTGADELEIRLEWQPGVDLDASLPLTAFIHVRETASGRLIGQSDRPPLEGVWPTNWWRSGFVFVDHLRISLSEAYNPTRHDIVLGLYPVGMPENRLMVTSGDVTPEEAFWSLNQPVPPEEALQD